MFYLNGFENQDSKYHLDQDWSLQWLASARERSAGREGLAGDPRREELLRLLRRYAGGKGAISRRGTVLEDFTHLEWHRMRIFDELGQAAPRGRDLGARMTVFTEAAMDAARKLLPRAPDDSTPPAEEIIHVTCTGYESPSCVQRWVDEAGAPVSTRVTHAYHMGCYAALPALRLATGALSTVDEFGKTPSTRGRNVDILHTEFCSLHVDPATDAPEQWVVQGLFADGAIRYRMGRDEPAIGRSFELRALDERRVGGSLADMSWKLTSDRFAMTLSRDVPGKLANELNGFVTGLLQNSGDSEIPRDRLIFAVHPGGPKIIDGVKDALALAPEQVSHSREVLRSRGNMSSATLPFIWKSLLEDSAVGHDTRVVSLAFGPGLTLCGSVFRKISR